MLVLSNTEVKIAMIHILSIPVEIKYNLKEMST